MRNTYYLLTACIITILFLSRCGHPPTKAQVFKPDALTPFTAEIDITRDTVLHTPEGSLIHIPSHALDAGSATKVRLIIREALKMSDMVRAGLLTTSDGTPLSSGGMIDIKPAPGQTVKITKSLTVSLPTHYIDTSMRLYKGIPGPDGNLSWTDPQPLSPAVIDTSFMASRTIFYTNCNSCHSLRQQITGPALAYIGERRSRQWLYAFTKNNQEVLLSGDRYANCIYNQYNKTPMNTFPALTDSDMDDLYRFIDYESHRLGLPYPDDRLKRCADSCDAREKANGTFDKRIREFQEHYKAKAKKYSALPYYSTTQPANLIPGITLTDSDWVSPQRSTEYYQFTINDFGWYNVDALLHLCEGVVFSELIARVKPEYRDKIDLYLVITSRQVLQQGGPLAVDSLYGFYTKDGRFPLPQGVQCAILAIGMNDSIPLAGITFFTATEKQTIDIDIHPSSKRQIDEYARMLDIKGITMEKTGYDTAISSHSTLTQNLRPLTPGPRPDSCDCDCGMNSKN